MAFYVSVLGFELVRDERDQPSAYVALARDTVQWAPPPGQRFATAASGAP